MSSDAMQIRDAAPPYVTELGVQQVPTACEQPEVGIKAGGWDLVSLRKISDFITKGSTPTTYGFNWESSGILFLRSECVSPHGLDLDQSMFISPAAHEMLRRSEVRDGDLLMTITGNVGRIVLLRGVGVANINQHIARVRISGRDVDPRYVYHVLSQFSFRRRFESITTGQAYPQISLQQVREARIPLPPLLEQRATAEVLSDVDGMLGALEALIAKKRAIKQAAMHQLLTGNTRLPGFSGEWETKRLGEIGHFLKGSGVKRDDARSGLLACVRYGEIYTVHNDYVRRFHSWISPEVAATATRLEYGDLLFAGSGETKEEIGKCVAIVTKAEAYAGGDIVILRTKDVDPLFFGYALNIPNVARQKASLGQGDAVVHISVAALARLSLAVPSIEEQTAIATVLSDMDAEIAALEARRDKTRAIKQGMMQQLLTGKVRLVKPEVQATQVDAEPKATPAHSKAFNEAVIISVLAKNFGKQEFPLGRKRYTKLSYLLHRHTDGAVADYLKKAAGPYNPKTKYGGPERIALQKGYIREQSSGKYRGFVSGENVSEAEVYFEKWYGRDALTWLEQFRYTKNDKLEALATVDMAVEELRAAGKEVNTESVKALIRKHSEWKAKLSRPMFSDAAIAEMIEMCHAIYGER